MTVTAPAKVALRHRIPLPTRSIVRAWPRGGLGAGIALLALIVLASIFVPIFSPFSVTELAGSPLQAPSLLHPFGTDSVGRDVFVRTFAGGRNDLVMVVIIVVISAVTGSLIGVVSASSSGMIDTILMRITDAIISFPGIVLVLAIAMLFSDMGAVWILPRGAVPAIIAIVVINWASYARLVRGEALSLKQRDFVTAATVLGYSRARIVFRHLLPNVATTVGAYMVVDAILAVITIAGLPFIGAGIQPPEPEWGSIMLSGATVLSSAWWVTILPGVVLAVYGIALSLIADSLLARVDGGSV